VVRAAKGTVVARDKNNGQTRLPNGLSYVVATSAGVYAKLCLSLDNALLRCDEFKQQ
jgi:hypothetical protein